MQVGQNHLLRWFQKDARFYFKKKCRVKYNEIHLMKLRIILIFWLQQSSRIKYISTLINDNHKKIALISQRGLQK